ncbi:SspB family protein [Neokomagataea thailandica]|uniref:Stringent starvation protein B n=1 Tax=Neokomagataea tanensis NBRC 106556 TaxID=1223519 RepID=A0ABQ0QI87_9PROT|nr:MULTISPECIES: ClpXP protease specificity-enhancing factor SspB [Neokomagataea]GBR45753.1 hypothetical protein AA106556_0879 [Neokomagataea tanensis NBRC 106556]
MSDDHNDDFEANLPESLLPYDAWIEDAYRSVMCRALSHVAQEGLPGEHHFYLTFKTNAAGVNIPSRLSAQYPQEMTIVLQHQFTNLSVDAEHKEIRVTLSFGGVPSPLIIPVSAVVAFADPHMHMAFRFSEPTVAEDVASVKSTPASPPETETSKTDETTSGEAEVVSLAAFRKRPTP